MRSLKTNAVLLVILWVTLVAPTSWTAAQTKSDKKTPEMANPEMAGLEILLGNWKVAEKVSKQKAYPDGAKGKGKMSFKRVCSGWMIQGTFKTKRDKEKYEAIWLIAWDPEWGGYRLSWFDSAGTLKDYYGGFDGKVLTLTCQYDEPAPENEEEDDPDNDNDDEEGENTITVTETIHINFSNPIILGMTIGQTRGEGAKSQKLLSCSFTALGTEEDLARKQKMRVGGSKKGGSGFGQ